MFLPHGGMPDLATHTKVSKVVADHYELKHTKDIDTY